MIIFPEHLPTVGAPTYSNSQLRRLEQAGLFPKRVKFSPNSKRFGYVRAEVEAWLRERIAERDGAAQK